MGDLDATTATIAERTTALTTWIAEQEANAPTLADGAQGAIDGALDA